MKNSWKKFFPYETPRPQQEKIIDFCIENFEDKRFVVVEAGTGVGKSAIGVTVARYLKSKYGFSSHFVTTQKILQDQYVSDFGSSGMTSIKSSSNYRCTHKKTQTCSDSQKELRCEPKGSKFWKNCVMNCPYKKDKSKFVEGDLGVTNFPYLITESNLSGGIKPKELLVIDEAHNIESELSKFVEVSVSSRFANQFFKSGFDFPRTKAQTFKWMRDTYVPKLRIRLKRMEEGIEKFNLSESTLKELSRITGQLDLVRSHLSKLNHFLEHYDKETWLFEYESGDRSKGDRFYFKPIDISSYSESLLFRLGTKVLLMSATILDHEAFCESVGIDKKEVACIKVASPFPIENRPIIYAPVGHMTKNHVENTLPVMIEAIKSILEEHKGEKGIIHTHSYFVANRIKNGVRSRRFLTHDSNNRDLILENHKNSKKDTVLVSPSMTEGVDLQGEDSRFQIICKIPYPFLGDNLVKKRMNRWKWWYPLQTAKTIVQSVGRSIRSSDDHAVTYILDSNWDIFYSRNRHLFAKDFKQCLVRT